MGRKSLAILLAFIAAGAAPGSAQDGAAGVPLDAYSVTRPGTVLIDRVQRLDALRHFGGERKRLCRIGSPDPDSDIEPIKVLEGRVGYGGNDRRAAPFDWSVIVHGADAFGTGSAPALDALVTMLTRWAAAGAMTGLEDDVAGSNTSVVFGLKRTLVTLIPNWVLVRDDPRVDAAHRKLIDDWVARLVTLADTNTGGANRARRVVDCPGNQDTSNCNNHRYLRDLVNIMWGAASGDNARYRKGVERYRVAMRQMRPDGSFPLETQRGARALWYQNYATGILVTMAETAARQGHDLYAVGQEGRTIHTAISFLLDGIETPRIVHAYAQTNLRPGPGGPDWREQDLRFTELRGRWHHMAWTEPYMARFPNHPNTARLRALLPGLFEDRPLATRTNGGNTSCLFVQP